MLPFGMTLSKILALSMHACRAIVLDILHIFCKYLTAIYELMAMKWQ